jgi:fructosamine-3-kinase
VIPPQARAAARALGAGVASARPVAGGDINRALRLELDDGRSVFVKYRDDAPAGMFRAEADSLARLAAAGVDDLRLPAVLAVGEGLLALEWIASAAAAPDHDERLGRGLARLHARPQDAFGGPADGNLATLPLPNAPCPTWPEFYARRRLEPLVRAGVDAGLLDPRCTGMMERLAPRLPDLLGPPEPPALLHGDLWGGNAMTGPGGGPVLVDPAAYAGHREIDLAMMRLFGGFGPRVYAAYDEAHPLAPGHEERVPLNQLFPLLVHAVLFDGGYGRRCARIIADRL